MPNLFSNSKTESDKPSEFSNSIQSALNESLIEFIRYNLLSSEKQNKSEFWQQLSNNNHTIVIKRSHFKGYHEILLYLERLSPAEIENTFRLTLQMFFKNDMKGRNFVFEDK